MREDLYSTLVARRRRRRVPARTPSRRCRRGRQENADRLERLREVLDEILVHVRVWTTRAELAALSGGAAHPARSARGCDPHAVGRPTTSGTPPRPTHLRCRAAGAVARPTGAGCPERGGRGGWPGGQ
ncbi:hypothetical protein QJS66_11025 [Kocuria rhizophila]|nr:hypothetical protein QJS66_11025 [Kocuria rhizophila]